MCAPLYELRRSTGSRGVSGRPSTSILTIALARTREHPQAVENQLRLPAVSIFSIRSWAEPSPRSRSHSWPPASHTLTRSAMPGTLDQSEPTASAGANRTQEVGLRGFSSARRLVTKNRKVRQRPHPSEDEGQLARPQQGADEDDARRSLRRAPAPRPRLWR